MSKPNARHLARPIYSAYDFIRVRPRLTAKRRIARRVSSLLPQTSAHPAAKSLGAAPRRKVLRQNGPAGSNRSKNDREYQRHSNRHEYVAPEV
jgi:hypothetical protein